MSVQSVDPKLGTCLYHGGPTHRLPNHSVTSSNTQHQNLFRIAREQRDRNIITFAVVLVHKD